MSSSSPAPSRGSAEPATRLAMPLRHADIDALGHVNHARYHEFLEEGRSAFIREWGGAEAEDFVMAHVELDHVSELRLAEGSVGVAVWLTRVGNSSIGVEHDLTAPDGRLVARGRSVLVGWDPVRRGKRVFDEEQRASLERALDGVG